jgi:Dolichyl-phosphate-mannose-protein mannosyltransferase
VSLPSALPLPLSAGGSAAAVSPRRGWEFWRSPDGQPPWARPALLGIAAVAALLYARNLAGAGLAPFYSTAVKSMSVSWKAFFYGAFDPKATITIDKLAGSFLPQALSARIFGFHPWALALPQVIEGVVSVLAMYRVVRRWAGPVPGLLAAGIFAATPIAASMFGHSMEDGALTMCLVLAADSWQRAVMEGRLRSLCWAGVWVGLGFQAKMLQAWMILPALGLGYLLAAPGGLGRRLWAWRGDLRQHQPDHQRTAALPVRQRAPGRGRVPARGLLLVAGFGVHPGHRRGDHADGRVQRLGAVADAGPGQAARGHRTAQILPARRGGRVWRARAGWRRHGDAGRQLGGVRVCRRPGRGLRSHLGWQRRDAVRVRLTLAMPMIVDP